MTVELDSRESSKNADFHDILISHRNVDDFYRQQGLRKVLKTRHLWAFGVGATAAKAFFGWNYGQPIAQWTSYMVAFSIVTVFYFTFMLTFAEIATTFSYAGGAYAYARRAFGKAFGFLAGITSITQTVFIAAVITYALGEYIHFLSPYVHPLFISIVFFCALSLVQILGIREASAIQLLIAGCAVSGFVLYLMGTCNHIPIKAVLTQLPHTNIKGILTFFPFALWFYIGSEGIAMTAEETKEPSKTIPLGFLTSALTSIAIAGTVFGLSILALTNNKTIFQSSFPLFAILETIQKNDKTLLVVFGALGITALTGCLKTMINAYSRQVYALSRAGYLPPVLARIHYGRRTPYFAVLFPGLLVLLLVLSVRVKFGITIASLSANITYLVILASFFKIRLKEKNRLQKTFRVPFYPLTPIIALLVSVIGLLSFVLFYHLAVLTMLIIYGVGTLIFVLWVRNNVFDDAPEEFSAESAVLQQKVTVGNGS